VTESSSTNTKSSDKWAGRSVLKPIPSHRTRWGHATFKPSPNHRTRLQRVALSKPSLQTLGQATPKLTTSHRTDSQRVALPEPSLQTGVARRCLKAE